jgi:hypothetical protein
VEQQQVKATVIVPLWNHRAFVAHIAAQASNGDWLAGTGPPGVLPSNNFGPAVWRSARLCSCSGPRF